METTKDKRVKREIANSNERRRMQSINAGFQKLKRLLPVNDNEKLSKASILQHASEFIQQIERDKMMLFEQNTLLRGILLDIKGGTDVGTALDNIDLDSLPIIPINTHLTAINNNNSSSNNAHNNNNNSNDTITTDNNSNDDCIKSQNSNKSINISTSNNIRNPSNNSTIATNPITISTNNQTSISTANISPSTTASMIPTTTPSIVEIICDRVNSPKNNLTSLGVAKAAIALPLEVPYTSETAIRVDHHQDLHSETLITTNARKILKTDQASIDSQDTSPKGQTLDTICKAIMEIEGDRVFTNENIKHEET